MAKDTTPPNPNEYHKNFTGSLTDPEGITRWFINGAYGREGGLPAIEGPGNAKHWYSENPKRGAGFGARDSLEHRLDGPAVIRDNGDKFWYVIGELHREDGPSVELASGTKKWFEKGKFVRQVLAP